MDSQENALEKAITSDTAPETQENIIKNTKEETPLAESATADSVEAQAELAPAATEQSEEVQTAVEEPTAEESVAEEVAQPVEEAVEDAVEVAQPAEEPVEEPAETPVADEPVAEETVEEPAKEPVEAPVVETPVAEEAVEEQPKAEKRPIYTDKQEVIARMKELADGDEVPRRDEVEQLKTIFYKLHSAEREADLKAYIEAGGNPETYQLKPDETEIEFKEALKVVKEKRSRLMQEQEAQKQANLVRKTEIIERIKAMATSPDEANKSYQEFKRLQQEWKEIKLVPAEKAGELWRNYQLYVEQFYDLLKLNNEAREYDFRKNLERKTLLCEAAEKLSEETDVVSAFHQLQKLHREYREIGPVSKDMREEIWNRFKAASTVVNKRHQQHFETLRAHEEENLAKKTALCEKAEEIAAAENKGTADYDRHTKEIIALQAEWKTIGFAPQKMNVKIFERFRAACDAFFAHKAEHFKGLRETFAANAEKKKALIAQARELQDSTDWKATADKLIALQKEWKTIGMVPRKQGDQLWNDFLTACNKFFNARNAATAGTRSSERENLQRKRAIIAQLNGLAENDEIDDMQEQAQQLNDEYNAIGHVPFKEKDKLYAEYRDTINRLYKEHGISLSRRRADNFRGSMRNAADNNADSTDNERSRLMRRYETMKQEIQTYENNIGFLNASSKKGSSLIDELNRKVQKLKDDMNLVRDKIKAIDAEAKQE